jgi:hypothetical protein
VDNPIQIFASDLDDASLARAREGLYPAAIETDVSWERLERFFHRQGSHYQVKRELRDMVLFANHSVLRDPPFSRLDLIACRNLLIYLQSEMQRNVFDIFHYALNQVVVFLGSADPPSLSTSCSGDGQGTCIYQARSWQCPHPHILLALTVGCMITGPGKQAYRRSTGRRLPASSAVRESPGAYRRAFDRRWLIPPLKPAATLQPGSVITSDLLAVRRNCTSK